MKQRDLQNEKIERFERELLEAGKVRRADVKKIVAAPQLFQKIQANIEAEKSRREFKPKPFFALPIFAFWNWRNAGLTFAALAILIFGISAFFVKVSQPESAEKISIEEAQIVSSENPPQTEDFHSPTEEVKKESEIQPRKIGFTTKSKVSNKPLIFAKTMRKQKSVSSPQVEIKRDAPFIALTFAGNFGEEERQIVRVEMSREKLLAFGVAVNAENESEKIKADLLIGADGVARAIRLVE